MMECHPARPEHAAELAAFMRRCYLAAYGHVASPADTEAHLAACFSDDLVAAALSDPEHCLLCTYSGPMLTGYAWLARCAAPAPIAAESAVELRRFYLAPEAMGSGAADQLMRGVLDRTQHWSARGLFLSVWKESERAIRFYGRHGFRALGTVHFRIGQAEFDDWLMWRMI